MDCWEFWKSYKLDTKLIKKIAAISKYLGILESAYKPISLRQALTRQERIKALLECDNIHFSLEDINDILTLTKQPLTSEDQRVFNLNAAYEEFNKEPVRRSGTIHGIHNTLSQQGMHTKGEQIRQCDNGYRLDETSSRLISDQIERLRLWIGSSGEHPLVLAAVFYYVYSKIQPFKELDQRVNRFCVVSILSQWDPIISALPLEDMLLKSKDAYDNAMDGGGPNELLDLLSNDIQALLAAQVKRSQDALLIPESQKQPVNKLVRRLLPVLKDGALSAMEILRKLDLKDVRSFRRNYLAPAIKMNLVGNTNPKSTSPHQEYALTEKGMDFLNTH